LSKPPPGGTALRPSVPLKSAHRSPYFGPLPAPLPRPKPASVPSAGLLPSPRRLLRSSRHLSVFLPKQVPPDTIPVVTTPRHRAAQRLSSMDLIGSVSTLPLTNLIGSVPTLPIRSYPLAAISPPLKSNVTGRDLLRAPSALLVLPHRADFNVPAPEPANSLPQPFPAGVSIPLEAQQRLPVVVPGCEVVGVSGQYDSLVS
jgi:hypothetical protein